MGKVKKENKKSNSGLKLNSLFDFDDVKTKKTKKDECGSNTNKSKSIVKSNSSDNVKKESKKSSNSIRKSTKVNSDTTKVSTKSKGSSKKTNERAGKTKSRNNKTEKRIDTTIKPANVKVEQPIETKKVGRRDRKHNWWKGCDYVWVDGIDHWVSKTAFRNDNTKNPIYTLQNYVQGLDSYWVMRYIPEKKK